MFTIIDYIVLCGSMLLSVCVGLYFGFWKKSNTADEYLLGNRTMTVVPIGLSVVASLLSTISILSLPADVYSSGINIIWSCLGIIFAYIVGYYIYLPVITKLKVPNSFEYLGLRFSESIKVIVSCLYTVHVLIMCSASSYLASVSFSHGFNPQIVTSVTYALCIFYTTLGGFRAVIWTDVLQCIIIVIAIIAVVVLGTLSVGGIDIVFKRALNGKRLDLNFSADMTIRDGFWQVTLGSFMMSLFFGILNPSSVQKYVSLSKCSDIKRTLQLNCCGFLFSNIVCTLIGLIIYATYANCDPISTGDVSGADLLVPHFVMEHAAHIAGFLGVFIAGLFSASLSTLSSSLNTLSATVYGDIISPFFAQEVLKARENLILKLIIVTFGTVSIIFALFIEKMGIAVTFIQTTVGLLQGIFVGLFSLGIFFPRANSKGAFWGSITSFLLVGTMAVVHQWYLLTGAIEKFTKPISVDGCDDSINMTLSSSTLTLDEPFVLFRLSHWYNVVISFGVVIVVGLLISYVTKPDNPVVDIELICPISRYFLKRMERYEQPINKCTSEECGIARTYNFRSDV